MIQAIWIITETGQCIFSHKYIKMDIEDQLISGLLTAFNAFSSESGIGGVQQIGGEDSQFVFGSAGKFLVAALADNKDDPALVENLMDEISNKFEEKYASYLADDMYMDLNVFIGFEDDIDDILFPKVHARGIGSTIGGTVATMALTIGTLLVMLQLPNFMPNLNEGIVTNLVYLIFLACIPGLFVGALTAGTKKYALIANTIGILPVIGYFAFDIATAGDIINPTTDIPVIILMAEQFIAIALLCALLGGSIIERRRLFPFAKDVDTIELSKFEALQVDQEVEYQQTEQEEEYYQSSFTQEQQIQEQTPPPPTQDYQQQDW